MSVGQFTYSELDDSIFEHIRKQVVAQGYYPDLLLYQPTTTVNVTAFNAALDVIKAAKNPINTIGVGAFIKKGEVRLNTIYIHRTTTAKGTVSVYDTSTVRTDGLTTPPDASTTYASISTKGYTQNVEYEVRFVATNQQDADVMSNILLLALTMGRDYFDVYDLSTGSVVADKEILLQFVGNQDLDIYEMKEYIYRFTVLDCWLVTGDTFPDGVQTIINPDIVPILSIDMDLETN